jgi:hypothetical protein
MAAQLAIEAPKRKRPALRPPPTKPKRGRPTKREQKRREKFKVEARREGDVEVLDIVTGPGWSKSMGRMIAASPIFFAQEVLTGSPEPPYNGRYLVGEHHIEWDQLVTQNQRVCVLAPRDHGKTFFFDFAYPIWKAVTMPGGIGFLFSATKDQAKLILEDIKTELETNPKLQHLVPSRKNKWRSDAIRLTNGHTIYARGYGTKVRGRHPHYIVCDDILNDETAYSEVVRQKEKDYFFTAVTNMITPNGQIMVIGTPFHKQDLYADLKKNPLYVYRQYRALNDKNEVLWPERYNRKRLKERREEIGSIRFSREFQCDPVSDDMSLFPGGLFRGETIEQYTVKLGEKLEYWRELGVTPYMGVDIAMSTTVKADYFVIWVMGPDARGNRWIIDIIRERGLGFQTQLSMIVEAARKYDPAMIFIEANQMQRVWGDELIRTSDLPIKKFTTTAQEKHALDKGVPGLRVLLENAKFRIPRGDERSVELTNVWREEMRSFTWHEGKLQSVGGHDDTVMGCWICNQAIAQGGFSFTFGDDDEDVSMDQMIAELTGVSDERTEEDDYPDNSLIDTDRTSNALGLGSILGVM